MDYPIFISVLAPGEDLGALARASFAVPGKEFLKALCSDPTPIVQKLSNDPTWPTREIKIVADLAIAPDEKSQATIKKGIPAVAFGKYRGNRRNKDDCESRQVIGHDFDHVVADSFEDAVEIVKTSLPGRFLAIHTTSRERNENGSWRLRVFEILDRPVNPAEWETRIKPHMSSLGEHDHNALDISRLLFLPIRTAGYRFAIVEGACTRVDDLATVPANAPISAPASAAPVSSYALVDRKRVAIEMLGAAWPAQGRHVAQLALAGALASEGHSEPATVEIVCAVCKRAGDEDRTKRTATVRHTFDRLARGEPFTGWTTLATAIDPAIVDAARGLLQRDARDAATFRMEHQSAPAAPEVVRPKRLSLAERARRVGGTGHRFKTGMPTIDAATRGGMPARKVGAIGGAPGAGKTAILVQWGFQWLSLGVCVGFLAADEDADAILIRFGQLAGLSRDKLEAGDPAERERLATWAENAPLELYDGDEDGTTIATVSADLRDRASGAPSVLLVDSMQTARTSEAAPKGGDARARINIAIRELKTAAKVDGHLVFATSELSKAAYRNRDQAENVNALSAFKESGDIEYGVAFAMVLTSRPGTSEIVDAVIVKNRLGSQKPEFMLRLDHARAAVMETTAAAVATIDPLFTLKASILDVVQQRPLSRNFIVERVGGQKKKVLSAINALLDEGRLVDDVRGVRKPLPGDAVGVTALDKRTA